MASAYIGFINPAIAAPAALELDSEPVRVRAGQIATLVDPYGELSIETVAAISNLGRNEFAGDWRISASDIPVFDYGAGVVWAYLKLRSVRPGAWVLEVAEPLLHSVEVYTPGRRQTR